MQTFVLLYAVVTAMLVMLACIAWRDLRRPSHNAKISAMSMPPGPYAVAVVLAAGLGTRVGADGNKAYLPLAKAQYLIATNWTTAVATAKTELVG